MRFMALIRKEITVLFRDRLAVIMILVAPLVMTTVMKLAFGNMNNGTNIPVIPVAVVEQDGDQIGRALVDLLESETLRDLVIVTEMDDVSEARRQLDAGEVDAVVVTPADLTEAIFSDSAGAATISVYGDPARPFASGLVRGIVQRFTQYVAAGSTSVEVTFKQLLETGRLEAVTHEMKGELGNRAAFAALDSQMISFDEIVAGIPNVRSEFNWFEYYALSMAALFILLSMVMASRTLLVDFELGTLARLRTTPAGLLEVLGSKAAAMLLVGLAQTAVLMLASQTLMGMEWGDPLAVAVVAVVMVLAAVAFGLMVAAFCRSAAQVNLVGSGAVLILGAIGGNFIPRAIFPEIMRSISLIGPNAWSIEAFQKIVLLGGKLPDVQTEILALLGLTVVFSAAALLGLRRLVR